MNTIGHDEPMVIHRMQRVNVQIEILNVFQVALHLLILFSYFNWFETFNFLTFRTLNVLGMRHQRSGSNQISRLNRSF